MKELIEKTLDLLNTHTKWQKRYKDYLDDIFKNCDKNAKGFHKPEGLSLYTTVSDRNKKCYALRFKGQNVGKVTIENGDIKLECLISNDTKTHNITGCPMSYKEIRDWKSPEAFKFRSYFKKLADEIKTKSPEHEVENALLKEFRKKGGNEKALRFIQPVLLHNCFFQMPTPLGASGHNEPTYAEQHGGGIDILARITTLNGRPRLCVIEIKDENEKKESQRNAMSQAITYATFISKLLQTQPKWWEFFMGHHFYKESLPKTLDQNDIEVVTIMPKGNTERYENEEIRIDQTDTTLHCHSLYYDKGKFKTYHTFDFSGTFLNEIKKG